MSPDLSRALKDAVAEPRRGVDPDDLARRARRVGRMRVVAVAATTVALVVLGALSANALLRPLPSEIGGDPGPERDQSAIPDRPRYEVVSGTYGDNWNVHYAGKSWRLLVWGDEVVHCWQLAIGNAPKHHGYSCGEATPGDDDIYLAGSTSFYTESDDPNEFSFIAGGVEQGVARLEFRPDGGRTVPIELYAPPPRAEVPYLYYAQVIPRYDYGEMIAFDANGRELERTRMCGPGCEADRDTEGRDSVATYESEEITLASRAAVFANAALGQAGLLDQFDVFYRYEGIAEDLDTHVATFRVSECSGPSGRDESYGCERELGSAWIEIGFDGDQFVVTDVDGPMTGEQRRTLLGYSEGVPDEGPEWRPIAWSVGREEKDVDWGVSIVLAWTGDLPGPVPDYGSLCRFLVYDSAGEVAYSSRELPFMVEHNRGEQFRISAPVTELAGKHDPAEVQTTCDEPTTDFDTGP